MTSPRRKRKAVTLQLPAPAPRNAVARALAQRRASGAAGKHQRSTGAQRRAERMALKTSLRDDSRD